MIRMIIGRNKFALAGLFLAGVVIFSLSQVPWPVWPPQPWRGIFLAWCTIVPPGCFLFGMLIDSCLRKWESIEWDAVETREQL